MAKEQTSDLTGKVVMQWFAEALSNRKVSPPSLETCDEMAKKLLELDRVWRDYTPPYPRLGKAGEYAGNFLKHLPHAREHSTSLLGAAEGFPAIQDDFQKVLDAMQEAEDAVRRLIATCDWATKPNHSWHGLTHHIRAVVILAWLKSGLKKERIPRSVNPDDPMCKLVTLALAALGRVHSSEAVSEALRGRRGTPRSLPISSRSSKTAKQEAERPKRRAK